MDEYIKKSDLKAELLRRDFYPAIVKSALETIPPADVVPRAMIADILGEVDKNFILISIYDIDFKDLQKKYTEGENKQKDFFSPEEVRAMSRKEVRENYRAIMDSIKKWNKEENDER